MIFTRDKTDDVYQRAIDSMKAIYDKLNANVPDYDLDELPLVKDYVPLPKEAVNDGEILIKGLNITKHYKVLQMQFSPLSELKIHTHYGYWEYIFILSGEFKDINGNYHKKGDVLLIDCYYPHGLKSVSEKPSEIIVLYAKDKRFINIDKIRKYLK